MANLEMGAGGGGQTIYKFTNGTDISYMMQCNVCGNDLMSW